MTEYDLDLTALRQLAGQLERAPRVRRIAGTEVESADIATEAALALLRVERGCKVMAQLTKTLSEVAPDSQEFADTLDDIAEEFRSIHYQIRTARLFNYVALS